MVETRITFSMNVVPKLNFTKHSVFPLFTVLCIVSYSVPSLLSASFWKRNHVPLEVVTSPTRLRNLVYSMKQALRYTVFSHKKFQNF